MTQFNQLNGAGNTSLKYPHLKNTFLFSLKGLFSRYIREVLQDSSQKLYTWLPRLSQLNLIYIQQEPSTLSWQVPGRGTHFLSGYLNKEKKSSCENKSVSCGAPTAKRPSQLWQSPLFLLFCYKCLFSVVTSSHFQSQGATFTLDTVWCFLALNH